MRVNSETGLKYCPGCENDLDPNDFGNDQSTVDGLRCYCRTCQSGQTTAYHVRQLMEDPTYLVRRDAIVNRSWLKSKYGITPERYSELLEQQNGRCAICKSTNPGRSGSQRFAVDHDHVTGEVRGLLCDHCNVGLGRFQDNPMLLQAATLYLAEKAVMTYQS